MDVLLKKISAVAVVNKEIVQRVEKKEETLRYQYAVFFDEKDGIFKVLETLVQVKVKDFCRTWKLTSKLNAEMWDIFNDHLDFTVNTWSELVTLNDKMHLVAQKFGLLDPNNTKALNELKKYLENLEILQTAFGSVEASLQDERSRFDSVKQQLAEINPRLTSLFASSGVTRNFIGSTLLSPTYIGIIARTYPGKIWQVAFRGSRDGFSSAAFAAKVAQTADFMFVLRARDGSLIGGEVTRKNSDAIYRSEETIIGSVSSLFVLSGRPQGAKVPARTANSVGSDKFSVYENRGKFAGFIVWSVFGGSNERSPRCEIDVEDMEVFTIFQV